MKFKKINLICGFMVLICACLTVCKNPIMETWWDPPGDVVVVDPGNNPVFHTVRFVANGGLPIPGDQLIAHNGKVAKLPAMTREHFGFGGWFTDVNCTAGNEWNLALNEVASDLILYAKWVPISHVIRFEANGGSPPPANQGIMDGGKIVEPAAMIRVGFGFCGWYTDSAFTTTTLWDFSDPVESSFTLYARWDENYRNITFNANGGLPPPINQRVAYGSSAVEPLAMTRTGHGFGGWFTDAAFIQLYDFTSPVTENVTLHARWVVNYYTITFVENGGSPVANQRIAHEGTIVEPPAMTREHYAFGGWFTDTGFTNAWHFNSEVTSNITLYAKWSPISFTVSFNENSGLPLLPDQELLQGSRIVKPPIMNRDNYGFGGWFTDNNTFDNEWDFAADTVNGNLTLFAKWDTPYWTVRFNENEGSPAAEDQRIVYEGKVTEPPAMTRAGFGFGGWFKDADFTDAWNFNSPVTEDLYLYAKWLVDHFVVMFNTNGGIPSSVANQVIAYGGRIVQPPVLTNPGNAFGGWFTDAGFTREWNFAADTVDRNITLHAKWSVNTYTVRFNADGGTPAPNPQHIVHNSRVVEPPMMSRVGYGFRGWFTDNNTFDNEWDFAADTVNGNLTLYARWVSDSRTVTFNANGGTPAPNSQQVASGGRVVEPPAMTLVGHGFAGWFEDDGVFDFRWNFHSRTVTENIILHAKWVRNYYTVTFDPDGGLPAPVTQRIEYGTRIARPAPMTKTGFSFGGWFTDEDRTAGNEWNFAVDTVGNSDIILYAKWDRNPIIYTVTFDADPDVPRNESLATPWPAPQSIIEGGKAVEPSPMRKAITQGSDIWFGFGGWFSDSAFTTPWNFATDNVNGNITLFAKWDELHCLVTFEANEGEPAPRAQDLVYGTRIVEPLAMTRPGFGFGGWFKDTAFTEPWDFTRDVVRDTNALTLYAHWVTNFYTITFEPNGGLPVPSEQVVAHGSVITAPPQMRKPNEGFLGWYRNADFTGNEWNFNTGTVNSDMTLYAKWGEAHYIIKFDLKLPPGAFVNTTSGHGNPVPSDQDITPGGRVSEPSAPNVAGWSFVGWYYSDDPAVNPANVHNFLHTLQEWDFNKTLSDDDRANGIIVDVQVNGKTVPTLTLYARWVPFVPGMVWVQKGSFVMGGSGAAPAHDVKLTEGYYMSIYQITQENYMAVTGFSNPSSFQAGVITRPVERVSWYDAIVYCNIRSRNENLTPVYSLFGVTDPALWGPKPVSSPSDWDNIVMNRSANGYRLPTEAEWEYAAKGGNSSPGNFTFAGSNIPEDVSWFNTNSGGMTHPVGTRAPNSLGLYDMNGNVSEWCWDWFAPYTASSKIDPVGPLGGTERVRRGGSWNNSSNNVRTIIRNSFAPDNATYVMGFRVVRGPTEIY